MGMGGVEGFIRWGLGSRWRGLGRQLRGRCVVVASPAGAGVAPRRGSSDRQAFCGSARPAVAAAPHPDI